MYKDVSLAIELKPKEQDEEEVKKNKLEQRSLIFEKLRKRELFNHNIKVLKKGAGELFQRNDHQDQFVHRIFILWISLWAPFKSRISTSQEKLQFQTPRY